MKGLLTALLGGVQGLGQGLHEEDVEAAKLRAEKMGRLAMAVDMAKNGMKPFKSLVPDDEKNIEPQSPEPAALPSQIGAPIQSAPTPPAVPRGILTSLLPAWATPQGSPTPPSPSQVQSGLPGGMTGTDAIRSTVPFPGIQSPPPMNIGGISIDMSQSQPFRLAQIGLQKDIALESYRAQLEEAKVQRKAQAYLDSGKVNPSTGRPLSPAEAMSLARNDANALDTAPVLGTPNYYNAKDTEGRHQTSIDVAREWRMNDPRAAGAAQTIVATTPGEVARSVRTGEAMIPIEAAKAGAVANATSGVNPPEAQLRAAGALQTAQHAKAAIDAYVQHYGSPGMMTQLAARYPSLGNFLDSKEGQVLRNAAINFLDASMDASGQQRYSGSVLAEKLRGLIPYAGDDAETLKAKMAFMEDAVHSMRVNAGAALPRGDTVPPGAAPANTPRTVSPSTPKVNDSNGRTDPLLSKYGIKPTTP